MTRRHFLISAMVVAALASHPAQAAARPDLIELSVASPPAAIARGMTITFQDKAKNRGTAPARSSTTGYYLSLDRVRNTNDRPVGARAVPRLPAGKTSTGTRSMTIPASTPLGKYFVLACADRGKVVAESREGNNCRSSETRVQVKAPTPCQSQLIALGHPFQLGPATKGVVDPITLATPLNGIAFVNTLGVENTSLMMDCTLALALDRVTVDLGARGIESLQHLGIYNYRCIGAGIPDDQGQCSSGVSQHAYATAIDFASFTGNGTTYSVLDDWVGGPADDNTCSAIPANAEDQFLHELVCYWDAEDIFNIILTPNYNDDHDNHFHADLTPGGNFIE
jgi:hypothetical protein